MAGRVTSGAAPFRPLDGRSHFAASLPFLTCWNEIWGTWGTAASDNVGVLRGCLPVREHPFRGLLKGSYYSLPFLCPGLSRGMGVLLTERKLA